MRPLLKHLMMLFSKLTKHIFVEVCYKTVWLYLRIFRQINTHYLLETFFFRGNLWGVLFIFAQPFGAASLWVGQARKIWVCLWIVDICMLFNTFFTGGFWSVKETSQSGRTRQLSMTGLSEYFLIFRALIFMMSISANSAITHSTLVNKLFSTCFQHFLWGKHQKAFYLFAKSYIPCRKWDKKFTYIIQC